MFGECNELLFGRSIKKLLGADCGRRQCYCFMCYRVMRRALDFKIQGLFKKGWLEKMGREYEDWFQWG